MRAAALLLLLVEGVPVDWGRSAVDRASVTGSAFMPVASLTVTPDGGEPWVFFLSGVLRSSSVSVTNAELRYLVNGVERGLGGMSSDGPDFVTTVQSFDLLPVDAGAVTVVAELREAGGFMATVDELRLVAFELPRGTELFFAEGPKSTPVAADGGSFLPQLTLPVSLTRAAPVAVLATAATSDAPNQCSIAVRVRESNGTTWPEARPGTSLETAHFVNPRDNWLGFFAARTMNLAPGDHAYDLEALGGPRMACAPLPVELRYPRMLAFALDGFDGFQSAGGLPAVLVTSTLGQRRGELMLGGPFAWFSLQSHAVAPTDPFSQPVGVSFEVDDQSFIKFRYSLVDGSTAVSYATFDIATVRAERRISNTSASPDGGAIVSRESVILALQLGPFDAGPKDPEPDAGLDAGAVDAGVPDAGVPDAGAADAGAADAGFDAGTPDAGTVPPGPRLAQVGCGCSTPGPLLVLLALVCFARRAALGHQRMPRAASGAKRGGCPTPGSSPHGTPSRPHSGSRRETSRPAR